jgi:hypothetical protein
MCSVVDSLHAHDIAMGHDQDGAFGAVPFNSGNEVGPVRILWKTGSRYWQKKPGCQRTHCEFSISSTHLYVDRSFLSNGRILVIVLTDKEP